MRKRKYAVIPGMVQNAPDGEEHFVSGRELMQLYGVDPDDCVVIPDEKSWFGLEEYIVLRPKPGGGYELPGGGK